MFNFSTGLSALRASQVALETISQNIANANTPGYHRQVAQLSSRTPVLRDGFSIGTGVNVAQIQRVREGAIENALTGNISSQADASVRLRTASQLESLLSPGGGSVHDRLQTFFQRLETLAGDPSNTSQRRGFLSSAEALSNEFHAFASRLDGMDAQLRSEVSSTVEYVNGLSTRISDINQRVAALQTQGVSPNDLLDQRDTLVNELAEYVDVRVQDQGGGRDVVLVGQGTALIGSKPLKLEAVAGANGRLEIVRQGTNKRVDLAGGKLAGLLTAHNDQLGGVRERVETLARGLMQAVDRIHSTGLGPAGSFSFLQGRRGAEHIDAPLSAAGLSLDVQSGDLFVAVTEESTGQRTVQKLSIDVSSQSLQDFASEISSVANVQASVDAQTGALSISAAPGYTLDFSARLESSPDIGGHTGTAIPRLHGEYTGSANDQFTFEVLGGGTVGVDAGLQVEVRNQAGDLVTTLDVGATYEPGTTLEIADGVAISFESGTLNAGDTLAADVVANSDTTGLLAALGVNTLFVGEDLRNIALNPEVQSDPDRLAASRSGYVGDDSNLAELLKLREQGTSALNGQTPERFLSTILSDNATEVQDLSLMSSSLDLLSQQLQGERDSYSGVDPNEELVLMLQHQRSFQAAARLITAVDSTLTDLMRMVG